MTIDGTGKSHGPAQSHGTYLNEDDPAAIALRAHLDLAPRPIEAKRVAEINDAVSALSGARARSRSAGSLGRDADLVNGGHGVAPPALRDEPPINDHLSSGDPTKTRLLRAAPRMEAVITARRIDLTEREVRDDDKR